MGRRYIPWYHPNFYWGFIEISEVVSSIQYAQLTVDTLQLRNVQQTDFPTSKQLSAS
ncbi:MAG: hypothetical protein R3Y53_10725 [Bacillota bacterium]